MSCEYCNPGKKLGEKLEELKIAEYRHWTVYLHINQCYLGRCVIVLNKHREDFFDIDAIERNEYFKIVKKLRDVIKELFGPDLFNYAFHGNVEKHVHLHLVPRYSKDIEILGVIFRDARWGHNYASYEKEFKIPMLTLLFIRNEIAENLKRRVR